jgi:PAS domain S-box-containing protein
MSEIFGYTKEELTSGLSHLDLTVEEDREKAAEFVRRRIAGEIKSIHYEFRGLCKDGAIRDIEVFGTATVFNGKPAVIGTLLDISGRKRAEKALKESEERFSKLFSENDDAIILFKLDDFVIFDANPATTELTGFSRDELLQLTPASIIDPDDFRRLIDVIPIDDQSKAFQITRAVTRRKDGSSLCVAIRAKILRMQEEYIVHCSIRDMSETYRLEDEVKNTQAKLIQTNKMTSIGMLASSVAHEINNPNNCISVNADMLTDVWRDAEPLLERLQSEQGDFMLRGIPFTQMQNVAPRLLNGITESSRRITAIVNNMREFVREDKSGLQGAIDVNHLVRNAASILWHHIHIYTDNFRVNLQEPLPPAKGNGQQIEQVIINLLMNALQALPDKTSGVQVETVDTSDQGIVTVIIRDEGSGMDHSVMSRLKEPFFSTKLGRGGTGLGLYISDAIIKEHEGELEFSSIPGKGTEATVRLKIWD